jgi:hypothetical protein
MKKKVLKTRAKSPEHDPELVPVGDPETIQAVVLAAAINGNQAIRAQLPAVLSAFEEPYRTAAATIDRHDGHLRNFCRIYLALVGHFLGRAASRDLRLNLRTFDHDGECL